MDQWGLLRVQVVQSEKNSTTPLLYQFKSRLAQTQQIFLEGTSRYYLGDDYEFFLVSVDPDCVHTDDVLVL